VAKAKKRATAGKKNSRRRNKTAKPSRTKAAKKRAAKSSSKKPAKRAASKRAKPKGRRARGRPTKHVAKQVTKITYEVVEHDGGWAYRVGGAYSETFPSHDEARSAAERAASEQIVPGDATAISWEDKKGHWHDEVSEGGDRPETDVKG
jgi:hypothetical protein